jgi:eukaryotic-like serine/threonine-protein kinase
MRLQTRFGKYELKRPLGTGASGTVYCAFDTFSRKEVALKVFEPKVLRDSELGEMIRGQFMNEAALAGQLSHPHIVSIFEAVMQDDSGYVAMEYVSGGNLLKFTRPDALLSVEEVIQIGFKSCNALDYAFREQGIVHRDIKPANILVASGTSIKVTDFGSALLKAAETPTDMIVGTPSYMSPEQIAGAKLTQYSDMYSLGVVLYELLTGRRPFRGANIEELFHRISSEPPPAPGTIRRDVPPRLDEIVLKMMSKRPGDRYAKWGGLAVELARAGKLIVYQRKVEDSEKFGILRKSELFGRLNDAHLWEIVHSSQWGHLPSGTTILRENQAGQNMFLLGAGELKVTKRGRLLNVLRAGDCFGEMAVIRGAAATRNATVEATTDVLIGEFNPAALSGLMGCCERWSNASIRPTSACRSPAKSRVTRS